MTDLSEAQVNLLTSYEHLSSRTVDLIGDYAGNELFIVEGDSLLLHCLDNDEIDLQDGFQMLHAVHTVEKFLHSLLIRKSNFNIVFFDSNQDLCIPLQGCTHEPKYKLIRSAIIRHLNVNLSKIYPSILIKEFHSYDDQNFQKYLSGSGVYFFMCHDGSTKEIILPQLPDTIDVAIQAEQEMKHGKDEEKEHKQSIVAGSMMKQKAQHNKLQYRTMIQWFIRKGMSVALIDSVQWSDTKIMAIVLEGSRRAQKDALALNFDILASQKKKVSKENVDIDISGLLKDIVMENTSEAQYLTLATLKSLRLSNKSWSNQTMALLLCNAIMSELALSSRRLPSAQLKQDDVAFLNAFAVVADNMLTSSTWAEEMSNRAVECDVFDLVDGRLFSQIMTHFNTNATKALLSTPKVSEMLKILDLDPVNTLADSPETNRAEELQIIKSSSTSTNLLPFHNEIFDKHLSSIHVQVSGNDLGIGSNTARTFRELTHWHNTKSFKVIGKVQQTDWQRNRELRSHQMFLRELQQYAASLTSSVGKSLDPEVLFVGQQSVLAVAPNSQSSNAAKIENSARLANKNEKRFVSAWQSQLKEYNTASDLKARYNKAKTYYTSLTNDRKDIIGAEVELYMVDCLLRLWSEVCKTKKQNQPQHARYAALIFDLVKKPNRAKSAGYNKHVQQALTLTIESLGLPFVIEPSLKGNDRPLSFPFYLTTQDKSLQVAQSPLIFQLEHCGPYLDRSIDSSPDPRVRFEPDAWQRKVLDLIDQKKSALVVAPTSAGKTFISFYAMRQVLQESDDGVLVYVAPTKALVNQIAAELQAQYTKKFKHPGKTVWSIHTRDYRVNEPLTCQILVTVPHVLQIMLLGPSNAKPNGWSNRVKRIIFDEVHSIGNSEDGLVWEQLLLLAPCPIIALSATVGNASEFFDWLLATQKSIGIEMEMVQHPFRYSDLRKFAYRPPKTFNFQPLITEDTVGLPSLDEALGFQPIHPIASLVNEGRGIPEDLHLEPRDCLSLWKSMKKHSTSEYPLQSSLDPSSNFPSITRKVDILQWEAKLKQTLKTWMGDVNSPFTAVLHDLTSWTSENPNKTDVNENVITRDSLSETTLPMLSELNSRNALPAILFNYDRTKCETIGQSLVSNLKDAQNRWKETSPKWKAQLDGYAKWKKEQDKSKLKRPTIKKSKGKNNEDDDGPSKGEIEREAAEIEQNPFASFDPDGIVEGFTFANNKVLLPSEVEDMKKKLVWRRVSGWLIEALQYGIGIHHAGMNRSYRQAVETLFRRGYLRVVIATGTLALGINMPCKTVVFSGDSIFLTALNYRQAAGRAGRRGFDLLGNVVFQGISTDRICRLMSSRLPDLNGHFPITTSLTLRLFNLLHDSDNSTYARKAINSLLSQPRLYLGGQNFQDQVLHHLRFSIEYLRRQFLIDVNGRPINFAGTVNHLYYAESSAFAFHCLLKDGYFNDLCSDYVSKGKTEPRILKTLMLVMAHLFGRRFCRRTDQEFVNEIVKKYSSYVFLPKMPVEAETRLRAHNAETLSIFSSYVSTFADQHSDRIGSDNKLPLTERVIGDDNNSHDYIDTFDHLPPTKIRSAFSALSGDGDEFNSISQLCQNVRAGVWLEEAAIPHVDLYPDEAQMPLNAYLYDFYNHGDVVTLAKANGIRRGDVWFLLNDFSLVLATIVTSFKNYLNVSEDSDLDMLDVGGEGDVHEMNEDARVSTLETDPKSLSTLAVQPKSSKQSNVVKDSAVKSLGTLPSIPKKKVVADSWDDDDDVDEESSSIGSNWNADDESTIDESTASASNTTQSNIGSNTPAWEGEAGEGLRRVALAFEALKKEFDEKFKKTWA